MNLSIWRTPEWHGVCFNVPMNRNSHAFVGFVALLAAPWLARTAAADINSDVQPVEELRHWAEDFVRQQLQTPAGPSTIHVTAGALDSRLRLKRCTTALAGIMPAANPTAAQMRVGVRCASPAWTVYVPVHVATEMKVLVLRQATARNASLTAADVDMEQRRVPGIATIYLTNPEQLRGRHLKQAAGPGTALTTDLVTADLLVKRGQRVTLVANAGGIEVRAQGEAIADATPAGRVRVLNLSSRKIVEGQVESPDQVRVTL
jgi:flagellar basal body P-ring formation protein FlgA